jgi:hypothetical protein
LREGKVQSFAEGSSGMHVTEAHAKSGNRPDGIPLFNGKKEVAG